MSGFDPNQVFHWGYVVPNMARAIGTWQRSGATVVVEPEIDPIQNVSCALLVCHGAITIELVAPLPEGPNPVAKRMEKGGGLDHVCLFTNDLAADLAAMAEQGGMIVVEPVYASVFDRQLAFVVMRSGLTVELMTQAAVGQKPTDPLAAYFALIGCKN